MNFWCCTFSFPKANLLHHLLENNDMKPIGIDISKIWVDIKIEDYFVSKPIQISNVLTNQRNIEHTVHQILKTSGTSICFWMKWLILDHRLFSFLELCTLQNSIFLFFVYTFLMIVTLLFCTYLFINLGTFWNLLFLFCDLFSVCHIY